TPWIDTLSLHDALPISIARHRGRQSATGIHLELVDRDTPGRTRARHPVGRLHQQRVPNRPRQDARCAGVSTLTRPITAILAAARSEGTRLNSSHVSISY